MVTILIATRNNTGRRGTAHHLKHQNDLPEPLRHADSRRLGCGPGCSPPEKPQSRCELRKWWPFSLPRATTRARGGTAHHLKHQNDLPGWPHGTPLACGLTSAAAGGDGWNRGRRAQRHAGPLTPAFLPWITALRRAREVGRRPTAGSTSWVLSACRRCCLSRLGRCDGGVRRMVL